jgi:hypothetical protein
VIRIPLERLLDRLAEQVGTVVVDPGTDPYSRAQLQAAAEILRNLAPRVQWRRDEELEREVGAVLGAGTPPADDPAMIEQLAARQLDLELERLRR